MKLTLDSKKLTLHNLLIEDVYSHTASWNIGVDFMSSGSVRVTPNIIKITSRNY